MMIPFPSSSSAPINQTAVNAPVDITGLAVGGTAIAAFGIGTAFFLYQYLRPKEKKSDQVENTIIIEETETVIVEEQKDGLAHICVNPSELEEIKQLLVAHKKGFRVAHS
jgi:hypothetical protein